MVAPKKTTKVETEHEQVLKELRRIGDLLQTLIYRIEELRDKIGRQQ